MKLIKLESVGGGKPHLKTTAKTDADFSKISSILNKSNIKHAASTKDGIIIFRDRFDMMKAEDLLGNQWIAESVNESAYTDETNVKSSLLNNNEFTNLLTPKVFNWIRTPNIKIFNWKGSAYVVTDGKLEIIINKNKPMSVIKPIGRVRGEIKKLYTANENITEDKGPCWDGYQQIGMKMKNGKEVPNCVPKNEMTNKTKKEMKEAKPTTSSAPGQWVAFLSMARGKKLLKTFDTARGAKMFLSKNVDKLLGGANVESVGIMTKTQWDEREAKYAIEGINEATNKTFKIPTQRGTLHIEVEEDPAGIFVDVLFNNVEVTMTDIQFPTGTVKITQKQKRVKLKEGINECGCGGNGGIKLAPMVSAVNEAEYKFGSVEYTAKNMTPTDIIDLVMAYHQSPLNKLVSKNQDTKIRVARDLGRLLGKNPTNPTEKGKESALLLYPYKQKLINTEEYKEIYKDLTDKLKKISNSLSRGGSIGSSSAAKAAAKADMTR